MFITRLLSGIVLLAVALVTIISGGWVLFVTLLAVSLIGMRELYGRPGSPKESGIFWSARDMQARCYTIFLSS